MFYPCEDAEVDVLIAGDGSRGSPIQPTIASGTPGLLSAARTLHRSHSKQPASFAASRQSDARRQLLQENGGSETTEAAVSFALKWLSEHQAADGSWDFDLRQAPCSGHCANPGRVEHGEIGATGLALLPFLGAGQTPTDGQYKKTVRAGLKYLATRMQVKPEGGDLSYDQSVMYGHGIASIALCEAYGMTNDREWGAPAQKAVEFIVNAQDPVGGGWRYRPHAPGDTSVLGWQMMALKTAEMASLSVAPKTIEGAMKFLDSVQVDSGAAYGYLNPGRGPATTAIGLLCRMYLGWKHDEPALERGVATIGKLGPSQHNMYYNYYATQVLLQSGGDTWEKWNAKMQDILLKSQAMQGHERGSWYLGSDHSSEQGGRLYCTSLAALMLESYYRYPRSRPRRKSLHRPQLKIKGNELMTLGRNAKRLQRLAYKAAQRRMCGRPLRQRARRLQQETLLRRMSNWLQLRRTLPQRRLSRR